MPARRTHSDRTAPNVAPDDDLVDVPHHQVGAAAGDGGHHAGDGGHHAEEVDEMEDESLPVGWVYRRGRLKKIEKPRSTLTKHKLVTGSTFWGKSGYVLSLLLQLSRLSEIRIVLVDLKGETAEVYRDHFLPVLAGRHQHIRPSRVVSIAPFGRYGVPLNPLHPIPDVPAEVQANLVCSLVGSLVDGGLGPRMTGILSWLARAGMADNGNLHDVLRMILDDNYRRSVGGRMRDPALREYLLHTFDSEPRNSLDSLRSRLEWILLLPSMRGMLCAKSCLRGSDLIESPFTIVDLGGAPQGFTPMARFIGSFIFSLVTAAVFSREVGPNTRQVILCVDEWQDLVRIAPDDFERLLAQARFRKVGVWLVNQAMSQIDQVSPALTRSLTTNIAQHVAFRPEASDITHLHNLLPVTGARMNPDRPEQRLTRDQERKLLLESYSRLPLRHALLGDRITSRAEVIRTLTIPYERAREQAAALPREAIEEYRKGRFGVPLEDLLRESGEPGQATQDSVSEGGDSTETEARAARQRRARGNRPKLELP